MTPQDFVAKWKVVQGKEIANAQPHFLDLCDLLCKPNPQPNGEDYTFEESVKKSTGGAGRVDVWKHACFAWVYKGPGRNLDTAYNQRPPWLDLAHKKSRRAVSVRTGGRMTSALRKFWSGCWR